MVVRKQEIVKRAPFSFLLFVVCCLHHSCLNLRYTKHFCATDGFHVLSKIENLRPTEKRAKNANCCIFFTHGTTGSVTGEFYVCTCVSASIAYMYL